MFDNMLNRQRENTAPVTSTVSVPQPPAHIKQNPTVMSDDFKEVFNVILNNQELLQNLILNKTSIQTVQDDFKTEIKDLKKQLEDLEKRIDKKK